MAGLTTNLEALSFDNRGNHITNQVGHQTMRDQHIYMYGVPSCW